MWMHDAFSAMTCKGITQVPLFCITLLILYPDVGTNVFANKFVEKGPIALEWKSY